MKTEQYLLNENGAIPNNPDLPLVIYREAFANHLNHEIKKTLKMNRWSGVWTNGVYTYHHYHSVSHEILAVIDGSATLIFGGPGGKEVTVNKGDVIVIPAGAGHFNKEASRDFKVMGAYPERQEDYDICTEKDNVEEKKKNIKQVQLPEADPVEGKDGRLFKFWH